MYRMIRRDLVNATGAKWRSRIYLLHLVQGHYINYTRRAPIGWAVWEPANQEPSSCVAAVGAHS